VFTESRTFTRSTTIATEGSFSSGTITKLFRVNDIMEGDSVMEIRTTGIEFDKTPKKNPANQISSVLVFFFV